MKREFFVLVLIMLAISVNMHAQNTNSTNQRHRLATQINFSPILFFHFTDSKARNIVNDYNFQAGLGFSIYKYKMKNRFGGSLGLLISTKNYSINYDYISENYIIFEKHRYSFLKIPILINYSYSIKHDLFLGFEAGIQFSPFLYKDYYALYPDGSTINKFPHDLEFSTSIDLVFNLSIEKTINNGSWGVEIKPFLFFNPKDELFFKHGFYNLGRLALGVSITIKKYFLKY